MTYEFPTDMVLYDAGVVPKFRKTVTIQCVVLFEVDVDADCVDGQWVDCSTPYVTGFRVKSDGEWVDVDDQHPLYGFLEAAFVLDETAMLEVARND